MSTLDDLQALAVDGRDVRAGTEELRVAVVHDYLTQRGGAERVTLSLLEAFPGARLITSMYEPSNTFPEFQRYDVETTWLNNFAVFRRDPRRAAALLPHAFSRLVITDVDLVVCSSSGWSHGVRSSAPKIVYCHNPARWLYQQAEYVQAQGTVVRGFSRALAPYLRRWDRRASRSVSTYLANSRAVAGRIEREYGRHAAIVPPAVTIDPDARQEPVAGLRPGFFLTVSRSRGYKNVAAVCEAVEGMTGERLVVVGGLPGGNWSPRLTAVNGVSDAQLRWLYANCAGVIAASYEDFGLTPVEGYAFGKPALCLRAGGFLDTLREGITGYFFDDLAADAIRDAVTKLRAVPLSAGDIRDHAQAFGFDAFKARLMDHARRVSLQAGSPQAQPAA